MSSVRLPLAFPPSLDCSYISVTLHLFPFFTTLSGDKKERTREEEYGTNLHFYSWDSSDISNDLLNVILLVRTVWLLLNSLPLNPQLNCYIVRNVPGSTVGKEP